MTTDIQPFPSNPMTSGTQSCDQEHESWRSHDHPSFSDSSSSLLNPGHSNSSEAGQDRSTWLLPEPVLVSLEESSLTGSPHVPTIKQATALLIPLDLSTPKLADNICPRSPYKSLVRTPLRISDVTSPGKNRSSPKIKTTPKTKTTPKRKARKAAKPQKSAQCWDPSFRGATLWFNTQIEGEKTQLRITSFFSGKKYQLNRCRRRHDSVSECKSSSESEDSRDGYPTMNFGAKTCASCGTRRTPLWRDAEDGTPLCNACGIRYRKYRVRCSKCWHIPKKDSKTYPVCAMCGGMLRMNTSHRKPVW